MKIDEFIQKWEPKLSRDADGNQFYLDLHDLLEATYAKGVADADAKRGETPDVPGSCGLACRG